MLVVRSVDIYLRMILRQLGYKQKEATPIINIDNPAVLQIITDNTSPTEWKNPPQRHSVVGDPGLDPR